MFNVITFDLDFNYYNYSARLQSFLVFIFFFFFANRKAHKNKTK